MAEIQFVGFFIEKEEYAINILLVQEIIHKLDVVAVPGSPDFMVGIISIRGKIIPVIDLRKRFGFPPQEESDSNRIVVLNIQEKTLGIMVDQVSEVLHISEDSISPPPQITVSKSKEYIEGIGQLQDRLIIILNIMNLFSSSELSQIDGSLAKMPDPEQILAAKKKVADNVEPVTEPETDTPEVVSDLSSADDSTVETPIEAVDSQVEEKVEQIPSTEEAQSLPADEPVTAPATPEVNAEQPVKRKRGRPRKIKTEEELNKPKRPRGRPRKNQ